MKATLPQLLFLAVLFLFTFSACTHSGRNQFIGKWKMARVKLVSAEQQQEMIEQRVAALNDSITKYTSDTAKTARYRKQIDQMLKRADDMKARQDSAIRKTVWEFMSNGNFEADMGEQKNHGQWSYDDMLNTLFTIVNKQAYSQKVSFSGDSMTLELDSVNYFKFVRMK